MKKEEVIKTWVESYIKGICALQDKLHAEAQEMLEITKEWTIIEKKEWKDPYWTIYKRTDGKIGVSVSVTSPGSGYLGFQDEKVESENHEIWTTWDKLIAGWNDLNADDFDSIIESIKEAKLKKFP
jgi:hypothetical protein